MKIFVLVICYAALPLVSAIAETKISASEKILGLVEIPAIFGSTDPNGPPGQTPPKKTSLVKLRAEPNQTSKVVLQFSKQDDVVAREHGYEENSAVAFGKEKGWFLIKIKSGKGWLAPEDAGPFHRYEGLVENGPSYLDKNWNGRLYPSPGDTAKSEQFTLRKKDGDLVDVQILAKKMIKDQLWFQIQIVEGRCEGEEKLGKKAWVPIYNEKGETNFWFYSRGC
jgi:hypothetical protein